MFASRTAGLAMDVGLGSTSINNNLKAHPDLNQGPADLQSAALTTELCTHAKMKFVQ